MEVMLYNQSALVPNQALDWNALITHLIEIDPRAAEVFTKVGATISLTGVGYAITRSPWGALIGGLFGLWITSSVYREG